MFVNILPKLDFKEKEGFKYDTENVPFNKNYIAFIEVPKRYQTVDQGVTNQLLLEEDENDTDSD